MILIVGKFYAPFNFGSKVCKPEGGPTHVNLQLTSTERFKDFTTRPEFGLTHGISSSPRPIGFLSKGGAVFVQYGKALAAQSGEDKTWFY